jgi:hypothetical protein
VRFVIVASSFRNPASCDLGRSFRCNRVSRLTVDSTACGAEVPGKRGACVWRTEQPIAGEITRPSQGCARAIISEQKENGKRSVAAIDAYERDAGDGEGTVGIYISEHHVVLLLATPWPIGQLPAISWLAENLDKRLIAAPGPKDDSPHRTVRTTLSSSINCLSLRV